MHDDELRRHLHRTTESDVLFDCDRLVDMLSSKTFIDHMTGFLHEIQAYCSVLVAVHGNGGYSSYVHQSTARWNMGPASLCLSENVTRLL